MTKQQDWHIDITRFNAGLAPLAFTDELTEIGSGGHASVMNNVNVLNGKLTQGPDLSNLTNGTQAGVVDELINFILDKTVATDESYALGETKLFKITPDAVTDTGTFPHTVTDMVSGESLVVMKGNLYYFYNKATTGDIGQYDLDTTFSDDWASASGHDLEVAPHPVDAKEDIIVFGNGRYVGTYIQGISTLTTDKLDFGEGAEVVDVIFANNQWYIAVNGGETGRRRGQIYLWDGGALETQLADETGVGMQEIGFLMLVNGVVWIVYKDETEDGFVIGYISGRQIVSIARYTGALPDFKQKTLYKGTISFVSENIYSAGAIVPELPFQLSQLASGGYDDVGGYASPFGTPMVASKDGTDYRIAKFADYTTDSEWKSIVFPIGQGYNKGTINEITVITEKLGTNAKAELTVLANQEADTGTTLDITGENITRHVFTSVGLGPIEDFKIKVDFSSGDTTDNVVIRRIFIKGIFTEA